jgi:hypothetical protein
MSAKKKVPKRGKGGGMPSKFTKNGKTYHSIDYGYKCWPFVIKYKRKAG